MADPEFWKNLALRFREVKDPYNSLYAHWQQIVHSTDNAFDKRRTWRISCGDSSFTSVPRSEKRHFEAIAANGGFEAKPHPGQTACQVWLECLLEQQINTESQAVQHREEDGTVSSTWYSGTVSKLVEGSIELCRIMESYSIEAVRIKNLQDLLRPSEEEQKELKSRSPLQQVVPQTNIKLSVERQNASDEYFALFLEQETVITLDVCWAAKQRYREWKRWIQGEKAKRPIKDGSKPDRAFRAVFASKQRPEQYRPEPRPPKWQ